MSSVRTAIAILLLVITCEPAAAQDPSGAATGAGTTAQAEPAPGEPKTRPKRDRLIDIIHAIVPPLVDAATSKPPPPPDPLPDPAPAPAEPAVVAPAISEAAPVTTVAPPPRPVLAQPRPAPPRPSPRVATPRSVPQAVRPTPVPPAPSLAVEPAPPVPSAPVVAQPAPAHLPAAQPPTLPAPIKRHAPLLAWRGMVVPLLGLLAAALAAAAAFRLRRVRLVAGTRAALAIAPRLDPDIGASSVQGLSFAAPPLTIRARLAPAGHG